MNGTRSDQGLDQKLGHDLDRLRDSIVHVFRPDNLLTNFVTWRGMLTKMLCSPYNKTEPWKVAATLYNGTIYLSEIETNESIKQTETQTARQKEMCYWGVKFEDYVTSVGELTGEVSVETLSCGVEE